MPTMSLSRRHLLFAFMVVLFILTVAIWSALLPAPRQFLENISPKSASESRVAALLAANTGPLVLPAAQKTFGCTVNGALPDPSCTPGAIFPDATPSEICVPGYTKQVRSVSGKLKRHVYAAYSIAYPQPTGTYELDHLIPLALGGSNDATNLFPEARDPAPGFKEKDVVELYLHEEMCAGHIPLAAAQAQIAKNWVAVYQALDPSDILKLKAKFRSWSK
jgi:hypothetical protein